MTGKKMKEGTEVYRYPFGGLREFPNFSHILKRVYGSKEKKKRKSRNGGLSATKAASHYLLCFFAPKPPCY